MKQPVGRIGGKYRIANQLIEMFPTDHNTYVEPFVGGGAVFYRQKSKNEVINDLDKDMYLIHNGLKENGNEVNDKFRRHLTKDEFYDNKKKPNDFLSILERYKFSFYANGRSYVYRSSCGVGRREGCHTDFSLYQDRLKDVIVRNQDYKSIIDEFDSPDTFFYMDPPYEGSNKTVSGAYKDIDPLEIYNSLKDIKGRFMLSYNDSDKIRDIFKDYTINTIGSCYSSNDGDKSKRKKVTELIIKNY